MGCTSSTQAGGNVMHDTIPFTLRPRYDAHDEHDVHEEDDNHCRNSLIDEPHRRPLHSGRGVVRDPTSTSRRGRNAQESSSSWGPICPASCQTEAQTLRVLPSVLGEDSPVGPRVNNRSSRANKASGRSSPTKTSNSCASIQNKLRQSRLSCHCDHTTSTTPLHHSSQMSSARRFGHYGNRHNNNGGNGNNVNIEANSPDTEETIQAFSQRQWLILPENKFDMNTIHPSLGPFLGTMYWTAASPLPDRRKSYENKISEEGDQGVAITPAKKKCLMDHLMDSPDKSMISDRGEFAGVPVVPSLDQEFPHGIEDSGTSPSPGMRFGLASSNKSTANQATSPGMHSYSNYNIAPSLNSSSWSETTASSTDESDWNIANRNRTGRDIDTSREILDYSALEESYVLHASMEMHRHRSPQEPRRLFQSRDEEEEDEDVAISMDGFHQLSSRPSSSFQVGHESHAASNGMKVKTGMNDAHLVPPSPYSVAYALHAGNVPTPKGRTASSPGLHSAQHPSPESLQVIPHPSPTVATFTGPFGSRRERHISTLPSQIENQPIRLRVTEIGNTACPTQNQGDFFSYDPYFSSGKFLISTREGRPYGNGLFVKMGSQFMTLEDSTNNVLAVIKSRYTHTPSHVVYAPKPRYGGQPPSGHRLTSLTEGETCVDGNNMSLGDSTELYPWALIQKSGRSMVDEVTVHLVDGEGCVSSTGGRIGSGNSSNFGRSRSGSSPLGIFNSKPIFRGRHEFDHELHTHTVVSRVASSHDIDNDSCDGIAHTFHNNGNGEEEVPCCVIVRDPSDLDAMDITIAPGIDPLLMICYLASHSKMDVEPIMGGY